MERQLEYVLRTVEERGVRFVRLWFTDVLGFLKSVEITPAELEVALEEGMTFDGSTIEGYSRIQESDMLAKPDPNTFELLPAQDTDTAVARMFCDIETSTGEPFDGDPRYVLKRNLERAREKGFTFFVGPEMEFFYFRSGESAEPLDSAGYFDLTAHDVGSQLRKQTVLRLEAMGIPVEYSFHENGPSQHEIDLRYTDALTMADNVQTFRLIAKEVAHDHGYYATFMPKPIAGAFGSGMHSHLSLFEGDVNAFHDPGDEYGLSKVAKHFIAGLLVHADEITGITNQWVNSYKRLIPGYEAPVYKCWARNNRSALVRVPLPKRGQERVESHRVPCTGSRVQSVPRVLADARGRPQGHRRGLRPPARGDRQHLRAHRRRAAGRRHRIAARVAARCARRDGAFGARRRSARRARVRELPDQQASRVGRLQGVRHPVRDRALPRYALRDVLVGSVTDILLVFPDPPAPLLAQTLDLAGHRWKSVSNAALAMQHEPADGWSGAIVCADDDPEGAFSMCRSLRKGDSPVQSILLLVSGGQLHELEHREDLFDDFCLTPFHPKELEARVRHLMFRAGRGGSPELASYGDLVLNFETYQAGIEGKPLDLTYMEYELLKFFVTHPGKVFTREQLLSRVWGYEYYGGARTVDVHVRRLRAKLGEEHAYLIQTVRSVGYRFGQGRWPGTQVEAAEP